MFEQFEIDATKFNIDYPTEKIFSTTGKFIKYTSNGTQLAFELWKASQQVSMPNSMLYWDAFFEYAPPMYDSLSKLIEETIFLTKSARYPYTIRISSAIKQNEFTVEVQLPNEDGSLSYKILPEDHR